MQDRNTAADFLAAQRYVGMEYIDGEFDCAHFCLLVQREVFGRALLLPTRYDRHMGGRAGQAAQINAACDELAYQVDTPVHGGVVLTVGPSDSGPIWHIGTTFDSSGEWWVLHNRRSVGVSLNKVRDIAGQGQRIEGYYQWK